MSEREKSAEDIASEAVKEARLALLEHALKMELNQVQDIEGNVLYKLAGDYARARIAYGVLRTKEY